MSHADIIAALRPKVENETATPAELKLFAKAVYALEKVIKDKERSVGLDKETANLQEARDILGADNVYGQEAVKATWDRDLSAAEIPPLPYSREQLEAAKRLNMMLILRVDKDKDGQSLTGKRMNKLIAPKLQAAGKGKLLYKVDWYANEPFYTDGTPKSQWKLVTRDVIAGSTNKDYADQTKLLRDTLAQQQGLTPQEKDAIVQASDAVLARLKTAGASQDEAVFKPAAQELAALKININHRRHFADVVFDHATLLQSQNERLFNGQSVYDWTSDLTLGGLLVDVGHADAGGVIVGGRDPGRRTGAAGVSLSR